MPHHPQTHLRSATPTHGSQTQTSTHPLPQHPPTATLRLRATSPPPDDNSQRVRWAEDVVDNEGLGRKKSKVCCIYHRPREVGESSSESSSSSDSSDSGSGSDDAGKARLGSNRKSRRRRNSKGEHDHDHHVGDNCAGGRDGKSKGKSTSSRARRKEGNAYEKQPPPPRRRSNEDGGKGKVGDGV
ncbi:MAG: hypothetical protein L6R42_005384 [Xanthoria sp. 1 TBL-2021]|nr:MAG: hypothetical protein L6R42_005384 [Xanthoria sp. 1 TBL-2021]